MSLSKDLTVTISNDSEGISLVFKTACKLGDTVISISGDMGVYDTKDIEKALQEISLFHAINKNSEDVYVG